MESLSRPPHRRKHSAAGNAFSSNSSAASFKSPYDGVLLSNGGRAKFGANDYDEMFAGESSIPVLDLSCLEERLGYGDCRSSKVDYSNIFGGVSGGDVGVPYEELFNGAARKTKTRISADAQSPSGKIKSSSSELPDQSMDGAKKHLNMSFNKTSQRISDASNGTHIAQLHAVPGFTYFVDGTPKPHKTEAEKSVASVKREVSRTWSFSAGLETSKVKSGLNLEKSNVSADKDQSCSKLPSFGSSDFFGKTAEENLPPLSDEELDENSTAAVSAAALKKAIEQAQESIRLAKMIMERKKEGRQDGLRRRSKKVKDKKETRGGEKLSPPRCRKEKFFDAGNDEVERVREDVEAAKEHEDSFFEAHEQFSPSSMQSETDYIAENVESDYVGRNVEGAEKLIEGTNFTGLVSEAERRNSRSEGMETDTEPEKSKDEAFEQCPQTADSVGEPENVAQVLENVHSYSQNMQEKVLHEEGGNLRTSLEDEANEEMHDVADDNGKCEEKIEMHELNYSLNESRDEAEKDMLQQDDMEKRSDEGNCVENHDEEEKGMSRIWFEIEQKLREPLQEEIGERGSQVFPHEEVREQVNKVEETEMDDKKSNYGHVEEGQKAPGEVERNDIAERQVDTSSYEAADAIQMESNNGADVKKSEVSQDAEETNDAPVEEPRSEEENQEFDFEEATSAKYFDEAIDAHSNGSSSIPSEAQEPCDDFQNKAEEYQDAGKVDKEDGSLPSETESSSGIDNKEARKLFHLEVDEMPETDSLRRSASEENFIGNKLESAFEGLSSESNSENMSSRDSYSEEKLPEDGETSGIFNETHKDAEEDAASDINMQNLSEVHSSDNKSTEFDQTSNEGSVSTSTHENIDEISTSESQGCDKTSNNTVETEREPETNQNMDDNKEKQKEFRPYEQNLEAKERIEAIKKGRAREKDRMAVERAIREARERAFAEARERAEREKAAAEARQRAMAEAREKPADKTSIEAKRRAERAAVERATAEARERALEKAMSQKTFTEGERASSSRNHGLKHSYSSSDLDGAGSESAQRRKARLERHQRIMERAAKALAEKNIRDILAQKEQAERNRLAESLDADIKRWSTGKEGNLRALLSTLQYILGQDSGWQPISLTEIITTAAVKKAYRKATLCVHPDKLQQRGASIQQKYICEKVFDLLKAAWNKFNSEER